MGNRIEGDATLEASPTAIRERKGTPCGTLSSYAQPAKVTSVDQRKGTFPEGAIGYASSFGANPYKEVFFDVFS